jgi:hypothetical protein
VYKKLTKKQWVLGVLVLVLVVTCLGVWIIARAYRPSALKGRMVAYLSDQLESEVTLDSLEGSFFPRISLSGGGLVVRQKGRTDVPPLITIRRFEIRASLRELMHRPRHVSEVRLQGLEVHISPTDDDQNNTEDSDAAKDESPLHEVVIDRLEAPDTVLTLIPRKAHKPPRVFTIHHLVMESVGRGYTVPYIAVLTNPVPKGEIEASGRFGPWDVAHPARTPVSGNYTFANADLDTINGLAGILSAQGSFEGPLNRIHVQGTTDTPDFQIDAGGQSVPLTTRFTATVDGSDGDTFLDEVDAKFLTTELIAKGKVIGIEGVPGRQIELNVTMQKGRVEDLLKLAMNSPKPVLKGAVQLEAAISIPPRKARVLDKLTLRGTFGLTKATFTDPSVQSKIAGLSRHGRGKKNDEPVEDVVSNLQGRFVVDRANVAFPRLKFGVPGATVELAGGYGLRSQQMDFHGHLIMDATISQAAGGGLKSFFLKAVDPFFKKNGKGTVLPIKITGSRKDPQFGLELFGRKAKH